MSVINIAVIPGDGIGREVIPAALDVLEYLKRRYDLDIEHVVFDWSADRWLKEGIGIPDGGVELLRNEFNAVLFGALGDPRIPDMAHGRAILLGLRRSFDLYVNFRPIYPLINPRLPSGLFDFADMRTIGIYRENTQGIYQGIGGITTDGENADVAIDVCTYTRKKIEKFLSYALTDALERGMSRITLVHKSNAVNNTGALWQSVFREKMAQYPTLVPSEEYVDSFCYHFVRQPFRYEAIVTSNLFGDIISDLGAAVMGGLGLAPSANICPDSRFALFEPVHGSAPDIAGQGIANPTGAILSLALLLEHHGYSSVASTLRLVLTAKLASGQVTSDLGGTENTAVFVTDLLRRMAEL